MGVYIHIFHQIWDVFSHYSNIISTLFSLLLRNTTTMCLSDGIPQSLVQFFRSFCFCPSDSVISKSCLQCHYFSCLLKSAFESTWECLISVIMIFSSRIAFLFIFMFYISLLTCAYCSYILYLTSLHPSPVLFKTIALKSLSSISAIDSFSGTVSVFFCFFSFNGHISCLLACLVIFFC